MRDHRAAKIAAEFDDKFPRSPDLGICENYTPSDIKPPACDECGNRRDDYTRSPAGYVQCAKCETWWKENPPPGDALKPGDNSEAAYGRAIDVCVAHYCAGSLKDGVFAKACDYLRAAQSRGEPAPDYIFPNEDGTLWIDWTGGERRHVDLDVANPAKYFAMGFAAFILGMAAFAAVATWGAK